MVNIRRAIGDDAAGVAAVYAPYVRDSYATFAFEPPSVEHWRAQIVGSDVSLGHVVLVAEDASAIVGYAYAGTFREREAYRPTVEVSVYVARPGQGMGKSLYESLFRYVDESNAHRAIASIALPNDASVRLHESFGFRHAGTLTEVGQKFGEWRDVAYYERVVGTD